jgi:hypothetical protein
MAKGRDTRDLHNSMERRRRIDLRLNLEKLQSVVPELTGNSKASKLTVLNKAAGYCLHLTALERRLAKDRNSELARNTVLKRKLVLLQKSVSRKFAARV